MIDDAMASDEIHLRNIKGMLIGIQATIFAIGIAIGAVFFDAEWALLFAILVFLLGALHTVTSTR